MSNKFWENKSLESFTSEEWESLCDRCGKCCTLRLEDIDDGALYSTNIVCKYFALEHSQCQCYTRRSELVPDCLTLTPKLVREINWLPSTCAYLLIRDGVPLPDWHPLISGSPLSVETNGHSIREKVISEYDVHPDDIENFILDQNW
ncbi:MAG: YcgN family cysteine cluster protein [Gammaproteobacteria bacterium]|nr:YcgN family cysteine cluster protein [Gammaproteobacteria bacterium]